MVIPVRAAAHDALRKQQQQHWTLHSKPLGNGIDATAVGSLPSHDAAVRDHWIEQHRFTVDPACYEGVRTAGAAGCPAARMTDAQVEQLREHRVVRPIAKEEVRGHVKMFLVPEEHKARWRPIKWTFMANEDLGPETLVKNHFPSKSTIAGLVNAGDFALSLDFAAYYDQILLSNSVGQRFCFRNGKGEFFALNTLAMGQRQAVQIAMACTMQLLNFPRRSRTEVVIDNIIFVGSREEVLADGREFASRCAQVGALLNEDTTQLEELVTQKLDWCGLHLDLVEKTVQLTEKTKRRIAESWARRPFWSWRGFAAHMGLLFWSWGIIDTPVSQFFGLLAFQSRASRMLTDNPLAWDTLAQVVPSAMRPMQRWTEIALCNKPRRVVVDEEPEWIICTDASRWGWGYCAFNTATGEVRCHGARWPEALEAQLGDQLGHSTTAEPHAITLSVLHLVAPLGPVRSVRIGTDNSAAMWSFRREFSSRSLEINRAITRLRLAMPDIRFDIAHIPGATNPADKLSRGGEYKETELQEVGESILRVMGCNKPTLASL